MTVPEEYEYDLSPLAGVHSSDATMPRMTYDGRTKTVRYWIDIMMPPESEVVKTIEVTPEQYRDVIATMQLSLRTDLMNLLDHVHPETLGKIVDEISVSIGKQ